MYVNYYLKDTRTMRTEKEMYSREKYLRGKGEGAIT